MIIFGITLSPLLSKGQMSKAKMIKQGEDWSTNCSLNSKDKDDYMLAVEAINKVNKDRIHRLN